MRRRRRDDFSRKSDGGDALCLCWKKQELLLARWHCFAIFGNLEQRQLIQKCLAGGHDDDGLVGLVGVVGGSAVLAALALLASLE